MADKFLNISISDLDKLPQTKVVKLDGTLDAPAIKHFDKAVNPLVNNNCNVLIDIRKLDYINSSGLVAVIRYHVRAKEKNLHFKIVGPKEIIKQMMELSGAFQLLEVEDTIEDAVKGIKTDSTFTSAAG